MPRRRQRWTDEAGAAAGPIDHRDAQLRLHADVLHRADVVQERQRFRVAAKQDVLTVVDDLSGYGVGKRGRASAEPCLRFEHEHPHAAHCQPDGSAQSGEPGSDDDDVWFHHELHESSTGQRRGRREHRKQSELTPKGLL